MFETFTDANGNTEPLELEAPDKEHTLDENYKKPTYSEWQIDVSKEGFVTNHIHNVEIIAGETAVLPVHLHPLVDKPNASHDEDIFIPPMLPLLPPEAQQIPHQADTTRQAVPATFVAANPHQVPDPPRQVFIPDFITVHLGAPSNTSARNVRVRFSDYVKNVIYKNRPKVPICKHYIIFCNKYQEKSSRKYIFYFP